MSIAARLFLAVGLPSVVLVLALGLFAWLGAKNAVRESLERELKTVVAMGASTINPVTARFLLPGDEETRSYANLVRRLKALKEATGSSRVVLIGDDEKVRADADGALPLFGIAPRVALDRTELDAALAGRPAVGVPFEAEDGRRFLAAYALVHDREDASLDLGGDESDKPPARFVLVLEAPADALDALDEVASYLLALSLLFVGLVLGLAVVVARTITGPLLMLADGAERLGGGALHSPLAVPPGRDEVALLGRTLEDMRRALLTRDEERQMMLAGIAHEVRNPLGGMELFSGLLEEEIAALPTADEGGPPIAAAVRDELGSHADRVRKELRYLTGVVNDFLAYARETGVTRENVDVAALLEDVRSLTEKVGLATVEVDVAVAGANGAPVTFPLDRGRIKEALLNLVENALQATPPQGKVTLGAVLQNDLLCLSVEDTGKGMPAETAARAFAPFFTTREKGSGLGLPLVRKFARDHGGDAVIESTPGQGTRVTVTLRPSGGRPSLDAGQDAPSAEDGANAEALRPADNGEPALLGDG